MKKCFIIDTCLFIEIRRGRYTLENRAQNIKEVKWLQQQQKLKDCQALSVTKEKEYEELIEKVKTAFAPLKQYTPEQLEDIPRQQREFLVRPRFQQAGLIYLYL